MTLTILFIVLFWGAVNAEEETEPAYTIEFDLDPNDCLRYDLEGPLCSMQDAEPFCPILCGSGYKMEFWNCDGEEITCKRGCQKENKCAGDTTPVVEASNFAEAANILVQQAQQANGPATKLVITVIQVLPCHPQKGCGVMVYHVKETLFVNGVESGSRFKEIGTECCCEPVIGGGGGGEKKIAKKCLCKDLQRLMTPTEWLGCLDDKTWPPLLKDAIKALKDKLKTQKP